jgi:hypothetical protein
MKLTVLALFLASFAATTVAETQPPEATKSSNIEFNAAAEVKAYYLKLLEGDQRIKRQFESLAKRSPTWGDAHARAAEPQVIAWYPSQDEWSAGQGFHRDQRFLIIHPTQFARPKWREYDFAVVSEFRVLHDGTTRIDPKDPDEKDVFVSNKITVQFLGFRELKLNPIKLPK